MAEIEQEQSPQLKEAIGADFRQFPFLKTEQAAKEKASEAKVKLESSKTALEAGEKRKALEEVSAKNKADYETYKKSVEEQPKFEPTQDNAMDLGALFSVIATMGVALGGTGKLSSMNALNAMGGMLKGWQSGRKDLFTKEQAIFDKETTRIKTINDKLLKDLEQLQKLSVTDKEARLLLAAEISATNPGIIAQQIESGRLDVAADTAHQISASIMKMRELAAKHGVGSKGVTLDSYFPGITFSGTPSQNEDKRNSINTGALSLATADDLKQYAQENPQYLGRQGQVAQAVNRYYDSIKNGEDLPDGGQPALIFAKKYAAYLVGYEKTLAGSNRGMTQAFQKRFNELMSQDQFNAAGFTQLMNEQMNEVARAITSKDLAITGKGLVDYGKNIYKRAELPTEANIKSEAISSKTASKADVEATAKGQGITVDEAKKRLKSAGFKIEGEE